MFQYSGWFNSVLIIITDYYYRSGVSRWTHHSSSWRSQSCSLTWTRAKRSDGPWATSHCLVSPHSVFSWFPQFWSRIYQLRLVLWKTQFVSAAQWREQLQEPTSLLQNPLCSSAEPSVFLCRTLSHRTVQNQSNCTGEKLVRQKTTTSSNRATLNPLDGHYPGQSDADRSGPDSWSRSLRLIQLWMTDCIVQSCSSPVGRGRECGDGSDSFRTTARTSCC